MQKDLKQGLGNWVDGDRFFNRETEMELFRNYLREGVSLLLVAPRRIGKTSFMREAGRRMEDEIIALHVDLQKSNSPEEAIVELGLACRPFAPIWSRATAAFGDLLAKVENLKVGEVSVTLRGTLTADNWRQKGDELVGILSEVAEQTTKRVVIFFDEVPILVNRILKDEAEELKVRKRTADSFMSWMRDNLLRHRGRVVFVVTGSIGLEPVLHSAGLSGTLNAFHSFELQPWKDDVAIACLLALAHAKGFPLPESAAARMVRNLGCSIPHHVQMYFDHVSTTYVLEERNGEVTTEFVDEIYVRRMTGLRGHPELAHMEERLRLVLDMPLFVLAISLLTEASVVGRLTPKASGVIAKALGAKREWLLETLAILEHDGYLRKDQGDFVFVSRLVRDWWSNRFGHDYQAAS